MSHLRLRNNTGISSERNLCFVNSIIQVLNNIPEFKEYFTSRRYKLNFKPNLANGSQQDACKFLDTLLEELTGNLAGNKNTKMQKYPNGHFGYIELRRYSLVSL